MEESKEYQEGDKQPPFDFKIKQLKRHLKAAGMKKSDINKVVAQYKNKVYTKVAEVKAKMEKEFEEKRIKDAIVAEGNSARKDTDDASDK